jgi:hypothetical protein
MNGHNDTNRPSHAAATLGCNDLKAALSAYLDDELTRDERLRADAHLVGCGACRDLVERAEELDETLREKFALDLASAERAIDAASVDVQAMQAGVFAAINADESETGRARPAVVATIGVAREPRWLPRIAIAASIAAAALSAAVLWRAADRETPVAPGGAGDFRIAAGGGRAVDPVAAPSGRATELASLDADERQLLYSTGVILTNLRKDGFEHSKNRTELQEVARYDELVDRLDALLGKLPPADRPTVALARETIEFLLDASDDPARWEELRRDMERTELDRKVDSLSEA